MSPQDMPPRDPAAVFETIVRNRKTVKVLSDLELPAVDRRSQIEAVIEAAGWAPFHRPCETRHLETHTPHAIVPWRVYALDASECRRLRRRLPKENAGKLPAMLASSDALLQVTWLPHQANPTFATQHPNDYAFEPTLTNMEHIAAAASAIQNMLLAATARGIRNYWSSGGELLRSKEVFTWLGIPDIEILLGSIFLFADETGDAEVAESKLRDKRPAMHHWMKWVGCDQSMQSS